MPELDSIVAEVAQAVGLAEGIRGVEAVLTAVARLEPVSVRLLGRAADLPVPIVAAICGELRGHGVISEERPVQFTVEGRRRFAAGGRSTVEAACPTCGGRGIALSQQVARLRRGLAAVADAAPVPLVELDQCHCTPKTKLRRVLAMHAADALGGRRILVLGDDDLTSIALLRFVRQFGGRIEELVVLDIDDRLLAFIGDQLEEAPFAWRCVAWDLREPLPPPLAARFDTVVTDPPYTVDGASLFLARAAEAVSGVGSNLFVSYGSRRPGAHFELQRLIAKAGFEIRALTRDFNDYVGAGALGGTSHLYHLLATTELQRPAPERYEGPLYTGVRERRATPLSGRSVARTEKSPRSRIAAAASAIAFTATHVSAPPTLIRLRARCSDLREGEARHREHVYGLLAPSRRRRESRPCAQPGRVEHVGARRSYACSRAIVSSRSGLPRMWFSARAVSTNGKPSPWAASTAAATRSAACAGS